MSNEYRKDISYIKQRLEYVSPIDYIIELENEKENLHQEKEEYKSRNEKAILKLKELNKKLKDILKIKNNIKEISEIENILNGDEE